MKPYQPIIFGLLLLFFLSCSQRPGKKPAGYTQPKLGHRTISLIEKEGFKFKDLNQNGALDPYEDWRLSPKERSKDLLGKMSLGDKVGMMLIPDIRMKNEVPIFSSAEQTEPITSGFNEEPEIRNKNLFTNETLPYEVMSVAGTSSGIKKHKVRHFIWRTLEVNADTVVKWVNNVQRLAEETDFGIPVLLTSNPRNHIASGGGSQIGSSSEALKLTKWPSELGLAAMRDPALITEFGDISRKEWLALGIRKGYMYRADLATEPRWQRIEGTFGEDPDLVGESVAAVTKGFQGDSLTSTSIAMTTKHFPGGGSGEKGLDAHFKVGQNEVFPAGRFKANMEPFKAAIKAGTSAIMPYYSLPKNTPYEEVGYAFNKGIIKDLLRDSLGFKGIINSDTGPIESMPWGVEELSLIERYKKALEAGVNLFSGNGDPSQLLKTVEEFPELEEHIDASVDLLLQEMFKLGLFENPYVDEEGTNEQLNRKEYQGKAREAQQKSVVLLRNEENRLPLEKDVKVYFEDYFKGYNKVDADPGKVWTLDYPGLELVETPEEADVILLWLKPTIRPIFTDPPDFSPLRINLSNSAINTDYVNKLTALKPTILVINYSNPFVIDEIYNASTKDRFLGVLATFGVEKEALLDVISGNFNPTGKMPITTPISEEVVKKHPEDLPGYLEDEGYPLFKFGEGLSYENKN